ncbi:MAG: hypothetical protein KJ970_10665 [Candidatus Eisenbacteria bacterium]|uniref:Uncharacterized protein n=1 Tax=Eiseniibacteriota bacterium TaxID=2212470 RepID=A0A948W790_UNCEI|nr:hypothetical protein [Candidatus Eisenbacteria bacterium]MBU2691376.1 hypothetical protein [Candidatus Eisenbacteria bacterium]
MSSSALGSLIIAAAILVVSFIFMQIWIREKHRDRVRREKETEDESLRRYEERIAAEEESLRQNAGAGTGGYIVVDLPDDQKAIFHDLLKGFEEYARLRGYRVTFSADSTIENKMAFKFNLSDSGTVVGANRVREDLKEYLERVVKGGDFDDLPIITSIEEHDLVVTILKNRITFLKANYDIEKTRRCIMKAFCIEQTRCPYCHNRIF